jgi:hypothetical protein
LLELSRHEIDPNEYTAPVTKMPMLPIATSGFAEPAGANGSPLITRITLLTRRAQYRGGSKQMHASIASMPVQPSPNGRRVGIRIVTFEGCSSRLRLAGSLSRQGDLCHEASAHAVYPHKCGDIKSAVLGERRQEVIVLAARAAPPAQ